MVPRVRLGPRDDHHAVTLADEDPARSAPVAALGDARRDDAQALAPVEGVGVRVRVRLGPYQALQALGGPVEVDAAVLVRALVEEARAGAVLRHPLARVAPRGDEVERFAHEGLDEVDRAVEEVRRRVGGTHGHRALHEDVARVEFGVHAVRRDADALLAVDERPDDRREARVGREQRVVDVERAVRGQVEQLGRQPRAPVVGDDDVRARLPYGVEEFVVVGPVAQQDRHPVLLGEFGDVVVPDLLVGVLTPRVRDDERHLVPGVEQRPQRAMTPGLVAEHDDPHMCIPPRPHC
ncbi:putative formyltransferase [Streptomyces sp. Tu6071]|nr:putative formyltransferase [Streptomyces sp. Tu6071]